MPQSPASLLIPLLVRVRSNKGDDDPNGNSTGNTNWITLGGLPKQETTNDKTDQWKDDVTEDWHAVGVHFHAVLTAKAVQGELRAVRKRSYRFSWAE